MVTTRNTTRYHIRSLWKNRTRYNIPQKPLQLVLTKPNKFLTATPTRVTTIIISDHLFLSQAQHKSSCCLHIIHSFFTRPFMLVASLIPWVVSHLQSWFFHRRWVPQRLFLHNSMLFWSVLHRWAFFEHWLPTQVQLSQSPYHQRHL